MRLRLENSAVYIATRTWFDFCVVISTSAPIGLVFARTSSLGPKLDDVLEGAGASGMCLLLQPVGAEP